MRALLCLFAMALALVASGCARAAVSGAPPPGQPVDVLAPPSDALAAPVTVDDEKFDPQEIAVETGRTVILTLLNRGLSRHGFKIELPAGPLEMNTLLRPGQSNTIIFEAPDVPGEYVFYCPDDRKIRGRLTVRPRILPSFDYQIPVTTY